MMTDTFTSNFAAPPASQHESSQHDSSQLEHEADASSVAEPEVSEPRITIVQSQPLPPVKAESNEDAIENVEDESAAPSQTPVAIAPAQPLPRPRETRIIAMINQKGGVGKTTSTVNLGAGLAHLGFRVLLIDLDPQAHLTLHLGIDPTTLQRSNYDLLTDDDMPASEVMHRINDNLYVLPAEVNLAGAETEMAPKLVTGRAQRVLKDKLTVLMKGGVQSPESGVRSHNAGGAEATAGHEQQDSGLGTPDSGPVHDTRPFDYILLDCPPSLGLLTINALTFAKEVFVPMQAHFLALQGLSKLLETVGHIRSGFNADLEVTGVVLCMHEKQTLLAAEVSADLTAFLEGNRDQDVPWRHASVLAPAIRRNIKLAESPSFGTTIFDYAPDSNGAQDYRTLAMSVVKQGVALGK